jgi:hypothetical protein
MVEIIHASVQSESMVSASPVQSRYEKSEKKKSRMSSRSDDGSGSMIQVRQGERGAVKKRVSRQLATDRSWAGQMDGWTARPAMDVSFPAMGRQLPKISKEGTLRGWQASLYLPQGQSRISRPLNFTDSGIGPSLSAFASVRAAIMSLFSLLSDAHLDRFAPSLCSRLYAPSNLICQIKLARLAASPVSFPSLPQGLPYGAIDPLVAISELCCFFLRIDRHVPSRSDAARSLFFCVLIMWRGSW